VAFIAALLFIVFITQFGNALNLWNVSFWGAKHEDARREVFEQTKSFRDSNNRDIQDLCLQYSLTDDITTKGLLSSTIRQRAVTIPTDALTLSNQQCLQSIQ
jgi:hypothetical protein